MSRLVRVTILFLTISWAYAVGDECACLTKTLTGPFRTSDDLALTDNIIPWGAKLSGGATENMFYFLATITVQNCGTSALTNVVVVDEFSNEVQPFAPSPSSGVTIVPAPSGGGFVKETLTWTVGTLEACESATLTVKVGTEANPGGILEPTSEGQDLDYNGHDSTPSVTVTADGLSGASSIPSMQVLMGNSVTCVGSVGQWESVAQNDQCGVVTLPAAQTTDCGSNCNSAVSLVDFVATQKAAGRVDIKWRTGYEVDNLGFHLYREQNGKRSRLTNGIVSGSALLAGPGTPLTAGNAYNWSDQPLPGEAVRYWLEDIDVDGSSTWLGPFEVEVGEDSDRTLPRPVRSGYLARLGTRRNSVASMDRLLRKPAISHVDESEMSRQWDLAGLPAVKVSVSEDGWYRLSRSEVEAVGLGLDGDLSSLRLYAEGEEQPIYMTGDWIEFYGLGLDTPSTDTRVYWLVKDAGPGRRLSKDAGKQFGPLAKSFQETLERRDRLVYYAGALNGEEKNFFGPVLSDEPVEQTITIAEADSSPFTEAALEIGLQGVTELPHSVDVLINGEAVGSVSFEGRRPGVGRFAVPAELIRNGENQLQLVPRGGSKDVTLVDFIRLSYLRYYRALNDSLQFRLGSGQMTLVDGFTDPSIRVFDVTNAASPKEVEGIVFGPALGRGLSQVAGRRIAGFGVAIPIAGYERVLLAVSESRFKQPAAVSLNHPSTWHDQSNHADFLVITDEELLDSAQALADYRQNQGLSVEIIDVEDLYDEFTFGTKTAVAIQSFLRRTREWKTPPRAVLFFGDASYDHRNYWDRGRPDSVPSLTIQTRKLETESDDALADFDGDGLADMLVGRLPVRTAAEAEFVISQIMRYEAEGPEAHSVLLVSDQKDPYFDYEAANTALQTLVPSELAVDEIVRGSEDDESVLRQRLMDRLNQGQAIVSYHGHGSTDMWRGGLFSGEDAATFTNERNASLYVLMTCWNGYFHDANGDSLAEVLLKSEGGGIAIWASSGITNTWDQGLLNQEFFRTIFSESGDELTLGEAVRRAKMKVRDLDVRRTWILFADPMMRLRLE